MTFLITAGPTREPIDPVRYLSNRSSGKMGYAIAGAASHKGCRVILISGPTQIEVPDGCDFIPVETASEMSDAVAHWLPRADVAIMSAAVSDYRIKEYHEQKMKKEDGVDELTLTLVKNPDILAEARSVHGFPGLLVGFAAETENIKENAIKKLERKGCDLILANDVSRPGEGFDSDLNTLLAFYADGEKELGSHTKEHLGEVIIELCDEFLKKK